jgi:hypothetical protein
MQQSRGCSACGPHAGLRGLVPLSVVQEELEPIETLTREIGDLTGILRAVLAPDQFKLVWSLRDAVERLALAEELLGERQMLDALARHLPASAYAIRAVTGHLLTRDEVDTLAADEPA